MARAARCFDADAANRADHLDGELILRLQPFAVLMTHRSAPAAAYRQDRYAASGNYLGGDVSASPRDVAARSSHVADRLRELFSSPRELTTAARPLAGEGDPVASRSSELSS